MPAIIGSVASSVLGGGPIQSIVGGILGGGNPVGKVLGGLAKGIGKLFGKKKKKKLRPPSTQPSPFQLPAAAFQNLTKQVQKLTGQLNTQNQQFGKIIDLLQKVLANQQQAGGQAGGVGGNAGAGSPAGPYFPNPGGPGGLLPAVQPQNQSLDATIDKVGNKAQSLMDKAQELAASDNPADQMKAQRMMQQAQRMIEFMSNMIKIIGDMQKNAIQNMR